jgi:hypothetical protein
MTPPTPTSCPFAGYLLVTLASALTVYLLRRSRIVNLALLLFTLVICVTGLEAYYRFFYAESDGFGRLSKNFNERYYRFDAYGLRASNLPLANSKKNLVIVGDSNVFGAGLKSPAERFSDKLAAHYPELHVINLGLPGWDTKGQIGQLTKYLGTSPAPIPLVVLAYFFNDIEEDVTAEDRQRLLVPAPPPQPTTIDRAFQRFSNCSRFVELFYYRVGYPRLVRDRLDQVQLFYRDSSIMTRHLASLEQFREVVEKQYSARLLVVTLPFLHSDELLHKNEFYENFRQALSRHGFTQVDLQPVFARHGVKRLRANRFDPHPNAFANQLIAESIIRRLTEHPADLQSEPPAIGKEPPAR